MKHHIHLASDDREGEAARRQKEARQQHKAATRKAATPAIAPPDLVIKQDGQRSKRAANIDGRRVDGVGRRHPRLMSSVCILFQRLSCACRVGQTLVCISCQQIVCHHHHYLVLEHSPATLSCHCSIVSGKPWHLSSTGARGVICQGAVGRAIALSPVASRDMAAWDMAAMRSLPDTAITPHMQTSPGRCRPREKWRQ